MRHNIPSSVDSYDDMRTKALQKIRGAARKGGSEVLDDLSEVADPKKRLERQANSEAVRMIVDKCLDDYREGEYAFKETKKILCEAIEKL